MMKLDERRKWEARIREVTTAEQVRQTRRDILALPDSELARPELAEMLTMVASGQGLPLR